LNTGVIRSESEFEVASEASLGIGTLEAVWRTRRTDVVLRFEEKAGIAS